MTRETQNTAIDHSEPAPDAPPLQAFGDGVADPLLLAIGAAVGEDVELRPYAHGDDSRYTVFAAEKPVAQLAFQRTVEHTTAARADPLLQQLANLLSEYAGVAGRLKQRTAELQAHADLAARLVGAAGELRPTLKACLHAAVRLLGADAGAIRTRTEDKDERLTLEANVGLSKAYIAAHHTLPANGELDGPAMRGSSIGIEDLANHAASIVPMRDALLKGEGLRSMITAGLVFQGEPLGVLRLFNKAPRVFSDEEHALLRTIGRQGAVAIANAQLLEEGRRTRQERRQMRLSAEVQQRMLPREVPRVPGIDIAARYESSLTLGGDFYDLFRTPSGGLGVLVGDVVGKGAPAALLMANVRSTLRAHAGTGAAPHTVIEQANRALVRDSLPEEFATIFYGEIDPETFRLHYCSAGHEPTLVVRNNRVQRLTAGGLVAGLDPDAAYELGAFDLQQGDTVFACTDGLSEAVGFDAQRYGRDRVAVSLLELLRTTTDASAETIAAGMLWGMRRTTGIHTQSDDTTIVALRVDGA